MFLLHLLTLTILFNLDSPGTHHVWHKHAKHTNNFFIPNSLYKTYGFKADAKLAAVRVARLERHSSLSHQKKRLKRLKVSNDVIWCNDIFMRRHSFEALGRWQYLVHQPAAWDLQWNESMNASNGFKFVSMSGIKLSMNCDEWTALTSTIPVSISMQLGTQITHKSKTCFETSHLYHLALAASKRLRSALEVVKKLQELLHDLFFVIVFFSSLSFYRGLWLQ